MPDEQAQINTQQLGQRAIKALTEKGLHKCPRCVLVAGWSAEVLGVLVSTLPAGNFPLPPPMLPMAVLTCNNCGFTSMHNLKVLGVLP